MGIIIQKFGGKLVATKEKMQDVAKIIINTKEEGNIPVVVISAIGNTTDKLQTKINDIKKNVRGREVDVVLSAGEQISMGLLAIMLNSLGYKAISLTGSQARNNHRFKLLRCKYIKNQLRKY